MSVKAEFSVINLTGRKYDTHEISGLVESGEFIYSLPRSITQTCWLDALNTIFSSLTDDEKTRMKCPGVMDVWQKTTTAILEKFPQLDFRIALFVSQVLVPLHKAEHGGEVTRVSLQSHDKWLKYFKQKRSMMAAAHQQIDPEEKEGEAKHTDENDSDSNRSDNELSTGQERCKEEKDIIEKARNKSVASESGGKTFEELNAGFEGGCLLTGELTGIEWKVKVKHAQKFRYIDVRFKPKREPGLDVLLHTVTTICKNLMVGYGDREDLWGSNWSRLVYFSLIGQGLHLKPLLFFVENRKKFSSVLFKKYMKNTIELVESLSLHFGVIVRISPKMGSWDTTAHKKEALQKVNYKKCVIKAYNENGKGLAKAITVAMHRNDVASYRSLRRAMAIKRSPTLSGLAERLQRKAGVTPRRFATTADFDAFQKVLPNHRLVVFGDITERVVLYRGSSAPSDIYLYNHEATVCLVTSAKGLYRWGYFCTKCLKPFVKTLQGHICWFMKVGSRDRSRGSLPSL